MNLTFRRQEIRPRRRFATSHGATVRKETIVVQIEHGGIRGSGEAVPSNLYGQSLESCEAALAAMPELLGDDPFAIEPTVARLVERFDDQRAAIDAVDAALHDWVGRRLGVPVWRLLGLSRPRVRTAFTIGVAEPAEIAPALDEALAAGFDVLKVKIGVAHDDQTLATIRGRFAGPLLLDANGAWTPDTAADHLRDLWRYRPELVEQPLAPGNAAHMGVLRRNGRFPLFVDEDCQRPADVVRLAGSVDGVNIKLNKCGGIRQALRMIALARELGLKVMVGCFVSSSLAIAPALAIASLADFADLDGALLLAEDPFAGISRDGAMLSLGEAPGLGVAPA